MTKSTIRIVVLVALVGSILAACGGGFLPGMPGNPPSDQANTVTTATGASNAPSTAATNANVTSTAIAEAEAAANERETHASADDYNWQAGDVVAITLNGDSISSDNPNVTIDGTVATIGAGGTYQLSGTLTEGQIAVDSEDEATVQLILNGVELHNSNGAAINIINAEKAVIILADQSENRLSDGADYRFPDAETDEPNATLFSKADLSIAGNGSLVVEANYNDAIASKDGLVIANGKFTVTAVDDGIRGKDYLLIQNGTFTIHAQGDGLKSDEEEDPSKGFIRIEQGSFQIDAGGDAIQGETDVTILDGSFALTTAGGSTQSIAEDLSAKGIKAGVALVIKGGEFTVDAADDAIHSNTHIVIDGGNYSLATGDDGIHADAALTINDGTIDITQSYEGIESAVITINGGNIALVASDDGVNAADGTGGGPGGGGGFGGGGPQGGGGPRGGPGRENVNYTGNLYLYINGGYLVVDAAGDGIDVNGAVVMTDGVVVVNGPTVRMNAALDYDGYYKMEGGTIIAAGSAGMAQAPGSLSSQNSLLVYFNPAQPAGRLIHIQSSDGEGIMTFAPSKDAQTLAFSSPKLESGKSYEIYVGGTVSGESKDGVYESGSYSGGTLVSSFTVSNLVTVVGR